MSFIKFHESIVRIFPFSKKLLTYYLLAGLFFFISLFSISIIHQYTATDHLSISPSLFSPSVLIILFSLIIAYFLTDGLRLYYVIRALDCHITLKEIMKLVFINIFISNVTPLATGGGFAQIYFMTRKNMPVGKAMAATTIRTVLAMMFLFVSAPLVVLHQRNLYDFLASTHTFFTIMLIVLGYFILFYCIVLKTRIIKKAVMHALAVFQRLHFLPAMRRRRWLKKAIREINSFSGSFTLFFSGHPGYILLAIFFTALFLLLLFSFSVLFIQAMGYHVPILTILAIQIFITFLMYFAPTPGASGIAEGSYALIFSRLINPADIAVLTLLWRFFTIYLGVIIGIVITYLEIFFKGKDQSCRKPAS